MHRNEYMDSAEDHDDDWREKMTERHNRYYGQYVTPGVVALVVREFGREAVVGSTDPHFNDLALRRWDRLVPRMGGLGLTAALKANGDSLTLCTGVCILKAAARMIRAGEA